MTYPYPAPEPRRSWFARHKILTVLGALVLLFVVIGVASSAGGSTKPTPTPATSKASTTASKPPTQAPSRTPAPPPSTTDSATPAAAEYGDGDYVVGEDIPAGTYTSEGATPGAFDLCLITTDPTDSEVWPQLKSANADEPIVITLSKADGVVSVDGCEPLKAR